MAVYAESGLMDYDPMYDAVYAHYGVEAVLTMPGTDGDVLEFTAIDITGGISVGGDDRAGRFQSEIATLEPAAAVRASDLATIDLEDLPEATLLINGKTWTVRGTAPKPSPNGEASGEVYLMLTEQA